MIQSEGVRRGTETVVLVLNHVSFNVEKGRSVLRPWPQRRWKDHDRQCFWAGALHDGRASVNGAPWGIDRSSVEKPRTPSERPPAVYEYLHDVELSRTASGAVPPQGLLLPSEVGLPDRRLSGAKGLSLVWR